MGIRLGKKIGVDHIPRASQSIHFWICSASKCHLGPMRHMWFVAQNYQDLESSAENMASCGSLLPLWVWLGGLVGFSCKYRGA